MTVATRPTMPETAKRERKPLGLVWVICPQPLLSLGLEKTLKANAHVHGEQKPPANPPSLVILCAKGEDVAPEVRNLQAQAPDSPVLVLGPRAELPLARSALQAGAKGFLHAQMPPEQVVRALEVAAKKGEVVLPRELLKAVLEEGRSSTGNLAKLTPQKREILGLVAKGLSNAQIARRAFLSESTIKQHLRAAYKVLGVRNRNQAARIFRRNRGDANENGSWGGGSEAS